MALIKCPECGNSISDKAEKCPHCGLPAEYFLRQQEQAEINYNNLANILVSFDSDYSRLFSKNHYITHRDEKYLQETYGAYYRNLKNKMIFQYIENHAGQFRLDIDMLKSFIRKMHTLDADLSAHNNAYVDSIVTREKEYFDHILFDIDPAIKLDDEQRRAVVTDDDYCLLVAGAGAGKTTTMAAKVKYLVEKQHINPEEIIVISYTRKAIGELKERINDGLHIPAEICTFHKFAYDIVKRFSSEPPEVNFSSYDIIFDMLEHAVFHDKALMRNLVLFLGYYFDLTEDVFKFDNLEQYHLYKASQDYYICISDEYLELDILAHEITHAELRSRLSAKAQKTIPTWFDEGIALQNDYRERYSEAQWIAQTDNGKNTVALEDMDTPAEFYAGEAEDRRFRYLNAKHELDVWMTSHGQQGLLELLDRLNGGADFNTAYGS